MSHLSLRTAPPLFPFLTQEQTSRSALAVSLKGPQADMKERFLDVCEVPSSAFCIAEKTETSLPITSARGAPSIGKCPALTAHMTLSPSLNRGKRSSSVGGRVARRRGVRRQDQFRVVDDIADIFVVADEADPSVRPFQPHQVTG